MGHHLVQNYFLGWQQYFFQDSILFLGGKREEKSQSLWNCFIKFIFLKEREEEKWKAPVYWFILQMPIATKVRLDHMQEQDLNSGLPLGWQEPRHSSHHGCLRKSAWGDSWRQEPKPVLNRGTLIGNLWIYTGVSADRLNVHPGESNFNAFSFFIFIAISIKISTVQRN